MRKLNNTNMKITLKSFPKTSGSKSNFVNIFLNLRNILFFEVPKYEERFFEIVGYSGEIIVYFPSYLLYNYLIYNNNKL